jgi:hypothetical protein
VGTADARYQALRFRARLLVGLCRLTVLTRTVDVRLVGSHDAVYQVIHTCFI